MKVNELKALFQKGVFQNLMPPTMNSTLHPPFRTQLPPSSKGSEIIQSRGISPPPQVKIQPSVRKNNDFLNQLNKKLMNKTAREKVIEDFNHQEEPMPIPHRVMNPDAGTFSPPRTSQMMMMATPKPKIVEEQLNFDDILGNADKKAVFRSGIRARLGVNERNPSTKEEEEMFCQWEQQRKSQQQCEAREVKENNEKINSLPSRATKMKVGAFHNNPLYSKLYTVDKVTRIDRILNTVFSGKTKIVVTSKPQPTKPMLPMSMPIPATVQMEAPQVQLLVKRQETIREEVVRQDITMQQVINQEVAREEAIREVVQIRKKEQSPVELPHGAPSSIEQVPNRGMFAMSKQMLSEMNMKIKRRNDLINNEKPQGAPQQERSVSPLSKKKKTLQKFDDA